VSRDAATLRVFYALVPPPALAIALGDLARDVARRAHGRPVPADNIHLTLAFIGAWPATELPSLLAAAAAVEIEPMRITLDTQGGFRRAGIAWIGASSPPPALDALAKSFTPLLVANGVAQVEPRFHPHVTLARRCRGPYPHEAVGPFVWDIDSIALIRSETGAEGARYTQIASWPLRGASA
jgi:RNA 2',3'-cyclic 3'-phosphodiesterase